MPTKTRKLSWKPVRRADGSYCSPACGGGCTWAANQEAHRQAKALAEKLGPDWIPRVWENLGWHYSAVSSNRKLKVHPNKFRGEIKSYTAFFGEMDDCGGTWTARDADPRKAVQAVIREAKDDVMNTLQMLLEILPC